ncbi:MAG: hypothetical protein BM556_12130 [Bacteriovorax sp. MedPE-SWde]|nr:MAG: hypothetical protein BM556_12130 [Bacteriovorax sp. MedPE-SWde]
MKKIVFYLLILVSSLSKNFKKELISMLVKVKNMLKTETRESKRMLEIYFNYANGKYNKNHKEDIVWANNQLKDVFKTFGVGALLLLPFAPITLPFLVKLADKLGVSILPDSYNDDL